MNRYKYFRWTPRTAKLTFWYVFAVPTLLGILAFKTEVSCSPLGESSMWRWGGGVDWQWE